MKQFLSLLAFFFCLLNLQAQNVGIGTTTPHASAALEIKDTTKGVLIPRMTTAQRDAIASPAVGLMILNLDDKCADIYNGTAWIKNCGFSSMIDTIPDFWTQKADFGGTARSNAVGFSIGTKGYIGTGNDGVNRKDFWEYDPAANSWTQKADFGGTARYDAVGFNIGTKGYIGTGNDGVNRKDFWEYDPAANSWTQKADFGGTARNNAVGFSIGTKGYIGTGNESTFPYVYKKDFWEYDPAANNWIQKTDFGGTARFVAVGFSIGTKGYIGTGIDGPNRKDFWEYDPAANSWIQKTDFGGTARNGAVGFSIGTKGYIGTGSDGTTRKDFWEYDPVANSWTQKTDFGGTARNNAVGFSIGIKGYIGTGSDGTTRKDFWEHNPYALGSFYSDGSNISNHYYADDGLWIKTGDTLRHATTVNKIRLNGNVSITGTNTLEFGVGVPGKEPNAGKIGYGAFTPDALDIVGAGTLATNRKIKFWNDGGADFTGGINVQAGISTFGNSVYCSNHLYMGGVTLIDRFNLNNGTLLSNGVLVFGNQDSSHQGIASKQTQGGNFLGLDFYTNQINRLAITNGGNVGIGTTTPSQKLDVTGNSNFSGKIIVSDSALLNGNTKVVGNAIVNGNVGIGTTTPSQKLDVSGNSNFAGKIIVSDSALLNGNAKITGYTNLQDTVYINKIIKQDAETAPALQNSWVNYGAPFADAKYYKDKEGVVHLKGLIKNGTIAANTILFTLPVGYRPSTSGQLIFTVDNATGIGRVDVKANGDVIVVTAASNLFLNLTGISFRAD